MKSLRTINNSILIEPSSKTEKLGNGLNIDARDNSRRKIINGKVAISCSELLKEGDIVYFPFYAADEISIQGKDYYLLNVEDIKLIESE